MRHYRGREIALGLLALVLLASAALAQETPAASDGHSAQPVGAWRVFVSPELPGDPVFVNLAAFHTDGTLIGFPPASPLPDGTVISGSTGLWRRESNREVDVVFYSTLYNGEVLVGYQRVRARIQLTADGRGFVGRFTNDILDPNDGVVVSIAGAVTGRRILLN